MKGMLGQIIRWERRTILIVNLAIFLGRVSRIMRSHEGHVEKERLLPIRLFNELNCSIRKNGARESSRITFRHQLSPLKILDLKRSMIRHPSHVDRFSAMKRLIQSSLSIVPLPYDVGLIPTFILQMSREHHRITPIRLRPLFRQTHPMAPRHQHRPTRHTNGSTKRTRAVVLTKTHPLRRQGIKIWSLDVGIPMRPNRVRPLIIGEKEDDIGTRSQLVMQLRHHSHVMIHAIIHRRLLHMRRRLHRLTQRLVIKPEIQMRVAKLISQPQPFGILRRCLKHCFFRARSSKQIMHLLHRHPRISLDRDIILPRFFHRSTRPAHHTQKMPYRILNIMSVHCLMADKLRHALVILTRIIKGQATLPMMRATTWNHGNLAIPINNRLLNLPRKKFLSSLSIEIVSLLSRNETCQN